MKEQVVFVGAGGHCKILIDSLDKSRYEIVGILDNFLPRGTLINGISVIGTDDDAESIFCSGVHNAIIAIVGNLEIRRNLLDKYKEMGFSFPTVVHPTSYISSSVQIGDGVTVLAGAIVNAEARLQDFVTVNTGTIVEHEVLIGENSHIAPGAILLGASKIGKGSMIGAGSTILQQIVVGDGCTIGAGSVVLKNVNDKKTVYGNPAKEKET